MSRLRWREKGTRLGCRRGWLGILGLAAFAIVGYLALYAWLRATGGIVLMWHESQNGNCSYTVSACFEGKSFAGL